MKPEIVKNEDVLCWVCTDQDYQFPHKADRIIKSDQHGVKGVEVACCARCALFSGDVRKLALKIRNYNNNKYEKRKPRHEKRKA